MRDFGLLITAAAALFLGACAHPRNGMEGGTVNVDVSLTVAANNAGGYFFIYEGPFFEGDGDFDFSAQGALYKPVAITFTLSESTADGLRFAADAADAMWIVEKKRVGEGSPEGRYQGRQFHSFSVGADGRTLSLIDENNDGVLYRYALRFTDKDGGVVQHDPDGQNGGPHG